MQTFSTVGLHRFSSWQFWGSIYTEEDWQSLLKASVTSQTGLSDTKLHGAIVPSGKYTRPRRGHNNVKENETGKLLQFLNMKRERFQSRFTDPSSLLVLEEIKILYILFFLFVFSKTLCMLCVA